MRLRGVLAACVAAVAMLGTAALAPCAGAAVSLAQVGSFRFPVGVVGAPGDPSRLFVVERAGRIQMLKDGIQTTYLDLTDQVKSTGYVEQGLLSLAFAPDYATSGTFYLYYTAPPAIGTNGSDLVIAAGRRADPDHGDPVSLRTVLRIPHRTDDGANGGGLQVGPDGMLWIGTASGSDQDTERNGQRLDPATDDDVAGRNALLGKLLRVDPAPGSGCGGGCTIPAGNPGFAQPEVWAYGLRNPWRISFDRQTGDLIIADVGQGNWEEVDFAAAPGYGAGADYGWNALEGTHPFAAGGPLQPAGVAPVPPVLQRSHSAPDDFNAITGGYVVRDPALPDLAGRYLYADYGQGEIHAVTLGPGSATGDIDTGLRVSGLTTFGEDTCGRVYVAAQDGPVYRLAQSGECGSTSSIPTPGAPIDQPGGQPALTLALSAASVQHLLRTGSVQVTVRCGAICSVTARGTFVISRKATTVRKAAAALPATATVKSTLAAGARVRLRLRASGATRRSLRGALRRRRLVSVRIVVAATDRQKHEVTRTVRSRIPLR